MKIKTWIKYMEGYYPTERSRKLRYKEQEDYGYVTVKEVSLQDTKLAIVIENNSDNKNVEYRLFNQNLYTKLNRVNAFYCGDDERNTDNSMIGRLKHSFIGYSSYFGFNPEDTKERMLAKAQNDADSYIIIENDVWEFTNEPVYAIYCFGCGNNHGGIGTSLSITKASIAKCNCGCYFNAFDREKAINEALKTANDRGDTNSIDYIMNTPVINVIIPDVIKTITNMNN